MINTTFCILFCLGAMVQGCQEPELTKQTDTSMQDKLAEFVAQGPHGKSVLLKDMTDFKWDKVYYFSNGFAKKNVEQIVGFTVEFDDEFLQNSYASDAYLLFVLKGKQVKLFVPTAPLHLTGTVSEIYKAKTATVSIHTKDPGPYTILKLS